MASLLSEFPLVSTEAWEQAIAGDLKSANCAGKLIWRSPEGIEVKPYYRAEDIASLEFLGAAPGEFPYVRGTRASGGWRIREEIDAIDPEEANSAARFSIAAGAEEIAFAYATVANATDLRILLANLGEIPVRLEHAAVGTVRLLIDRLTRRPSGPMLSADLDWSLDPAASAELIANALPHFVPFTIRADTFGESGSSAIEEVGFALASGVDFLAQMQQLGCSINRASSSVAFSFAMGPEYFMQIAKLRAFRMAWAQAVESFGGARASAKACIYARTSRWNRTIYDLHVNMLRATTEAMSAVLGGADSIYVAPFDECCSAGDETSQRLACNLQIILKQESHLAHVADPGGGAYYLEYLTDSIAQKAWKQLQEIEASGGYRKAIALTEKTLELRKAEQENSVITRRRVLTGTNRFANATELAFDGIGGSLPHNSGRAAVPFEELRLRTERHAVQTGKSPRILLAEIGDAKMRAARASFVAEFFACAGLDTTVLRFESAQQIADSSEDLIVLCSSDPEYLPIAKDLLSLLKSRESTKPVLIAGNPENAELLRAAGVSEFIHLRSNPIELLTKAQQLLDMDK